MSRRALYLAVDPYRARIALRESDRLVGYRVEFNHRASLVGHVFKGRVRRVLPGMQAAFIDVGLDRDGFLHVGDTGGLLDEFVDMVPTDTPPTPTMPEDIHIGDVLQVGQEVVVQVLKDGFGAKGVRLTTDVTLAGRTLVYLPTAERGGVSRRIADDAVRERLRRSIEAFDDPGAWILRTAGAGTTEEEMNRQREHLVDIWTSIRHRAAGAGAPVCLHRELPPAVRAARDLLTEDVTECWIDDEETLEAVVDMLRRFTPSMADRVRRYDQREDMMEAFGIDHDLERALKPRVWLKSGGYLVVSQTEALVAIDVNTGKFVGSTSLEDTALRVNLEAVEEIVRQLRLRDLGGIIVIDFIDLEQPDNRRAVYDALAAELRQDPASWQLLPMSDIGLVQLTRKRTRPSLERTLTRRCPHCDGRGRIKSLTSVCLELRQAVLDRARTVGPGRMTAEIHPEVARHLRASLSNVLEELRTVCGIELSLEESAQLHPDTYRLHP